MKKDMFGIDRYKVGLHIHTDLSDGECSPEEAARIYKEAGFDAIAFTDHGVYGKAKEMDGIEILSGCEYHLGESDTADGVIHIVGVGMKNDPEMKSDATRQEIVDTIKENGGIAIWAHPAWSLNSFRDTFTVSGFDAVEIYNTVSNVDQSSRPYSGYFVDVLANGGVIYPLVATDDTHYYNGIDETRSYIWVKAKSGSQEDIIEAILNKEFYATQGPELHVKREGNKIVVHSSPCVMINFLSNIAWAPDRILRGENLTNAEYTIKPCEKWIRVEITDENGNFAWSNIIEIKNEKKSC